MSPAPEPACPFTRRFSRGKTNSRFALCQFSCAPPLLAMSSMFSQIKDGRRSSAGIVCPGRPMRASSVSGFLLGGMPAEPPQGFQIALLIPALERVLNPCEGSVGVWGSYLRKAAKHHRIPAGI